ncbi:MAG: hypothetical protein GWM98_14520, partial [Nitrospinaceae bacterium]|nr:hypothetical protein [Nitrospinaceae bacterium]NIR55464.1 hypothetical protein [Nitrospinaceae bacterium]NIS85904.1 hypothetical protein [Nitrospinaceae bacterium]NIT82748.1 hypothetical protein [Nitrospinaceae bacterium]NIU44957.1 hypothetical protein [Nitrospinaceae bacterium]
MVINISQDDKNKYLETRKKQKVRMREKRSSRLSQKAKLKAFKELEGLEQAKAGTQEIKIDEHVKMNDNYMRTGPYRPKKK